MLGLGRAIGETIAVTLVIGNAPSIGKHIFDQGYTLAAVIANEFGEAASQELHRSALIAAGPRALRADAAHQRPRARVRRPRRARAHAAPDGGWPDDRLLAAASRARRRRTDVIARGLLAAATVLALVPLALVLYYVIKRGIGSWSIDFFTDDPSGGSSATRGDPQRDPRHDRDRRAGDRARRADRHRRRALPRRVRQAEPAGQAVRYFVDVLTGVPSIVFGLFIYTVLILSGHFGTSPAGRARSRSHC